MRRRGGRALVEILVVVVIVALLAALYLRLSRGSSPGAGRSIPKAATDKARDIECANNLKQLRALLEMTNADAGRYPAALNPRSAMSRCPVSDKPYSYDPRTGRVWCTTPGHETF